MSNRLIFFLFLLVYFFAPTFLICLNKSCENFNERREAKERGLDKKNENSGCKSVI